jgi:hypothetical protein
MIGVATFALLFVGVRTTFDISLRQELRARSSYASDIHQGPAAADILLTPQAGLEVQKDQTDFKLSYFPRFYLPEFYARFLPLALHRATASFTTPITQRYDLGLDAQGTYGAMNFSNLVSDATTSINGLQPVPQVLFTNYLSVGGRAGLSALLVPRLRLDTVVDHTSAGGADKQAQIGFPVRNATRAGPVLTSTIDSINTVGWTATGERDFFSNGVLYWSGESTVAWTHRFSRIVQAQVAAGGSLITQLFNPGWTPPTPYPIATVNVTQTYLFGRERGLTVSAYGMLRPYFDRLTTLLYERMQLGTTLSARLAKPIAVELGGIYALSMPTISNAGTNVGMLQASITGDFHKNVSTQLGTLIMVQKGVESPNVFTQWMMFFSVVLKERI